MHRKRWKEITDLIDNLPENEFDMACYNYRASRKRMVMCIAGHTARQAGMDVRGGFYQGNMEIVKAAARYLDINAKEARHVFLAEWSPNGIKASKDETVAYMTRALKGGSPVVEVEDAMA